MIRRGNIKIAIQSIRGSKWRSLLTMLGIIIGVVSVVTTVSLGEGVKQQLRQQINQRGQDLITVLPGEKVVRDEKGAIVSYNPLAQASALFPESDYKSVQNLGSTDKAAPFARVNGRAQAADKTFSGSIIATTSDLPELLNQKVEFGSFFDMDEKKNFAVIGITVAEQLFGENVPVGRSFQIRDQNFVVIGIFEEFAVNAPIVMSEDYNRAIFIPYDVGKVMMGGSIQIQQILATPKQGKTPDRLAGDITKVLLHTHGGQQDFTVLKQDETMALASNMMDMVTSLIAGVAAISLIVGGIGVMNIMLVAVSERTVEIGVRKAVGATNKQILSQFLTEACILSLVGGIIGVLASILLNFTIRVFTDLQPVVTLPIIGMSIVISIIVGAFFGAAPALRAAHKDPIEALRYE